MHCYRAGKSRWGDYILFIQITQLYEADSVMEHNFNSKTTIPDLAGKLGANFVTLKKELRKSICYYHFPGLRQRTMDYSKTGCIS